MDYAIALDFFFALALVVLVIASWLLNIVALPGNWVIVAAAALYALFRSGAEHFALGWQTVAALAVLAALGELLEFGAGAAGSARAGGSKRGMALAAVGSIAGGIIGVIVGLPIPIPVIGSLVTAVLGAAVGALIGAALGEQWKGRPLDQSIEIGWSAFWGRVLGSVAKLAVGSAMVLWTVMAVFLD